ncbi:MAG TPA: DoxX family protein [Candidatus Acidoferrales bacterium]|nr:DoxX family protein [Candidatus Acidoferrales bacterium]
MTPNSLSPANALSRTQINFVLLFLRVASGLAFLYHGGGTLFGMFGGHGPVSFAAGMHAPVIVGYLVGLAQFGGGLAVLSGVLTRVGAVCIAMVMIGAIFLVHLPHGFDIGNGGMEYALTQLLIALALLVAGAGDYSLAPLLPAWLRKL